MSNTLPRRRFRGSSSGSMTKSLSRQVTEVQRQQAVQGKFGELKIGKEVSKIVEDLRVQAEVWNQLDNVVESWFEVVGPPASTEDSKGLGDASSAGLRGRESRSPVPIVARYLLKINNKRKSGNSSPAAARPRSRSNTLLIENSGVGHNTLLKRIQVLERMEVSEAEATKPRFFLGTLADTDTSGQDDTVKQVTFIFQWVGLQSVTALKQSIDLSTILSKLAENLQADVVLNNVQGVVDVTKAKLFGRRRQRSHRSVEIRTIVESQVGKLDTNFLAQDEELLATWNSIRHELETQATTWMVLGYHGSSSEEPSVKNDLQPLPSAVPTLLAKGGDGFEAFSSDLIISSTEFRPGWLYWIYARVDVENIEGTGRFRANSGGGNSEASTNTQLSERHSSAWQNQGFDGESILAKAARDKFVLISFSLPAQDRAMFPTMSLRLLHHRAAIAQALKYHIYLEARSLSDLSEAVVVNKVLSYSYSPKIILPVFVGTSKSSRSVAVSGRPEPLSAPVMIRIDPNASLSDLQRRIASAYNWKEEDVVVMKLERDNNAQVMRTLATMNTHIRSEAALTTYVRNASTKVGVKQITGGGKKLRELGMVSGDELYVQLSNSSSRRASVATREDINQTGLVERRRMQIQDFLGIMEKRQKQKQFMYQSLQRIGGNTNTSGLTSEHAVVEKRRPKLSPMKSSKSVRGSKLKKARSIKEKSKAPSKGKGPSTASSKTLSKSRASQPTKAQLQERKKNMAQFQLGKELTEGRARLRRAKQKTKELVSDSAQDETRFNHSTELLETLVHEAESLGARLVDDEDLIIFDERVLGDGRTARVREGLLLCNLVNSPGGRSSSVAVHNRSSWFRMRHQSEKPSMASSRSAFLGKEQKNMELAEKSSTSTPKANKKGGRTRKPSVVSLLPEQDSSQGRSSNAFDFVALKVAVKMFTARFVTKVVFQQFLEEISVLAGLVHPSIVQILGVYIDQGATLEETSRSTSLMIMYELMPRGSLRQLREMDSVWLELPFNIKVKMALDVARGIEYLHTRDPPLIHRDLKSDNLLVDEDLTIKIGDFGISTRLQGTVRSKVGTGGWTAPEVLMDNENGYGLECDIFSFGVILWELVTSGRNPFAGMVEDQYIELVKEGNRPDLPPPTTKAQSAYNSLVNACWEFNPSMRPKAREVVASLTNVMSLVLED